MWWLIFTFSIFTKTKAFKFADKKKQKKEKEKDSKIKTNNALINSLFAHQEKKQTFNSFQYWLSCVHSGKMRLIILNSSDRVGEWAAKYVLKRIRDFNPGPDKYALTFLFFYDFVTIFVCGRYFVLGLPTGSTPLGMYRKLVEYHRAGKISFKYVKTFNMDEYASEWFVFHSLFIWMFYCHSTILYQ